MELSGTLAKMGVPLFDMAAAPLTGLVEEDMPVWLSGVSHKAVIKVDERETTAAAVMVMEMTGAAPRTPAEPFVMICDRPFVFVLYGTTRDGGNLVLFTGVVNQPQP